MDAKRKLMADFSHMLNLSEARALSKVSLERPLEDNELSRYKEVMGRIGVVV